MSAVTYATAQILRVLPRARMSQLAGQLADVRWPEGVGRAVVALYSRLYDVSLDDCEHKGPWPSFDAFFTRKLRHEARSVGGDPRTILSPADGRIESLGPVGRDRRFMVKGRPYSVEELVGSASEAERFTGGAGFVVYLSPRDYHRVHAPVGGVVRRIRSMPGDYFPVNGIGLAHVPNLFCRNRRVAFEIDADGGADGPGRVTVVMVAAIVVGRITTRGMGARDVPFGEHTFDPPLRVERGGELGIFHLGSTAVVFVEERAAGAWLASEGPVRYGQPLLRRPVEAETARSAAFHVNGSAR
jgi:phosphatidylserine decarboxylase